MTHGIQIAVADAAIFLPNRIGAGEVSAGFSISSPHLSTARRAENR
jgi:hypothetical protein